MTAPTPSAAIQALNGRPGLVRLIDGVLVVEPLRVALPLAEVDGKPTKFSPVLHRRLK